MSNPFPGVNPFVETSGRWTGFHNVLAGDCSKLLNRVLPPNYAAFVDERLELATPDANDDVRPIDRLPDVGVVRDFFSSDADGGGAAVAEIRPAIRTLPSFAHVPESYIDIRSVPDQELVTSIEILSPTNKSSNRGEYRNKRAGLLRGSASLVEIDLLLGGRHPELVEPFPAGDFFALVCRGDRRPQCEVYGWSIRQRLPKVPIPLRPGDPDVFLDLMSAYDATYVGGRFDKAVRYDRPLAGTLSDADRSWVAVRVASAHQ